MLHGTSGEELESASSGESEVEDDEIEDDDDKEEEANPLIVKEKKEKIDKTNLWFNKVTTN